MMEQNSAARVVYARNGYRWLLWALIISTFYVLSACSAVNNEVAAVQPVGTEVAMDVPTVALPEATFTTVTETVSKSAATQESAIQEPESVDWLQVASKEGDLYVLGNPNAPIRLVDYSDFL